MGKSCSKSNQDDFEENEVPADLTQEVKVVILGEARVGKTSLLIKYCKNQFSQTQISTINATYLSKVT